LATVAVDRTAAVLQSEGLPRAAGGAGGHVAPAVLDALTEGYARAFVAGGILALIAAGAALALPRRPVAPARVPDQPTPTVVPAERAMSEPDPA
jgi:hypothetical protein